LLSVMDAATVITKVLDVVVNAFVLLYMIWNGPLQQQSPFEW